MANMSTVPRLYFSSLAQPNAVGFETWRQLMAPMYDVRPAPSHRQQPGGSTVAYLLGNIVVNRTMFTAQRVIRNRRLAENTPDHLLFQFWRAGGYTGEIEDRAVRFGAGTMAFADRRRTLDVHFWPADTLGLIVPRSVFAGLNIAERPVIFDSMRSRLLIARMTELYGQLHRTELAQVDRLSAELNGFVRRIMDPSTKADVLEGAELDEGHLARARQWIRLHLGQRDLSPEAIARALQISRATLYRVFAAEGGVMQHVHEQRLSAVRDALADPLEMRSVTRLAGTFGVGSLPHFSRSFRARFGCTPRAWRQQQRAELKEQSRNSSRPFIVWFNNLSRGAS